MGNRLNLGAQRPILMETVGVEEGLNYPLITVQCQVMEILTPSEFWEQTRGRYRFLSSLQWLGSDR